MKLKKILAAFLFAGIAGAVYSVDSNQIAQAKAALKVQLSSINESLIQEFEVILPGANSLSGIQPDAFIGKVFPSPLPHLSVGVNASVTPVKAGFVSDNMKAVSGAVTSALKSTGAISESESFSFDFQFPDTLPYPAASVSARVGGFVLPFDIGLWGVTTGSVFHNKSIGNSPVLDFEYTALGADVRYAILEGNGIFPKVSIGAGYQFVRQNIGISFSKGFTIQSGFQDEDGTPISGNAKIDSGFNLKIDTHTFFGQIQVSKTFLIVTPYLGLKALFTTASCGYDWKYESYLENTKINALSDKASKNYIRTYSEVGIQTQIFGGVSLNLAFFQTCLNAAYNFSSQMFTGSLGVNFKL